VALREIRGGVSARMLSGGGGERWTRGIFPFLQQGASSRSLGLSDSPRTVFWNVGFDDADGGGNGLR